MKISVDKESWAIGELNGDEGRIMNDDGLILAKIYHLEDGKIYISKEADELECLGE